MLFATLHLFLVPLITDEIDITGFYEILVYYYMIRGTAVAQWLRYCATDRNVAGSIPAGVTDIDIKSFRLHYGPGVDSASNKNEFQEYFLEIKAAGA